MTQLPPGAFRPGDSLLHALDAGVKIICFVLLMAALAVCRGVVGHGVMAFLALAVVYLTQLERAEALEPLKRLSGFFAFVLLTALLFTPSQAPWLRFGILAPSAHGLIQGMKTLLRASAAVLFCTSLTSTTTPMKLASGLEKLLSPLERLGIPAHRLASLLALSLQLIPILFEEGDNIRRAQLARGGRFSARSWANRPFAMLPLVLPLTLAAFRRARDLAMVMESRGAGASGSRIPPKWEKPGLCDISALLVSFAALALQLVVV